MPIVIACPSCKAKLKAPDNVVGKKVKCPGCSEPITVRAPAPAKAPPPRRPEEDFEVVDEHEDDRPRHSAKTRPEPEEDDRPRRTAKSRPEPEDEDDRPRRGAKSRREPEEDYEEVEDARDRRDDFDEDEDDAPPRKKGRKSGADPVPQSETTPEERSAALIFWVLMIVLGPIGLIWWIIKKKDMPFVDYQGKQWLNFAITAIAVYFLLGILGAIGGVVGGFIHWAAAVAVGGLVLLVMMGYSLATLVYTIIALIKAKDGVWYRIPHTFQLFK